MKGLLKFITCGSVDDGKSTLIGHILYASKLLYADQEKALELDSRIGSRGGNIDYSLLLDGLMAEREQGITIDVAYRYFTTEHRSFIVADTPGHEEYTRNMAVGASFADLAVILLDAGQGVLLQTRRHARICALMGIRYFVFAVNKMDLAGYEETVFQKIQEQIRQLSKELGLLHVTVIPVSATEGDNVTEKSENTKWYTGEALLPFLEAVDIADFDEEQGFYMPVQRVCRPNHAFRGFQGQIESGRIRTGDSITVLPGNEKAGVRRILAGDRETDEAVKGQPVTIQLDREVDVSRGCILSLDSGAKTASAFEGDILWMDDAPLTAGKNFFVKIGTKMIPGIVTKIIHAVDVNTGERRAADHLEKNELARCRLSLASRVVLDEFASHKTLGEVLFIDRITNGTSACGVITKVIAERGEETGAEVTPKSRAAAKGQKAVTIIFRTGEEGAGRRLAESVERRLASFGRQTYLYAPKPGETFEETVKHLHDAGLVVLLLLDEQQEKAAGEKPLPGLVQGWRPAGDDAEEISRRIRKESEDVSYLSVDRDYI